MENTAIMLPDKLEEEAFEKAVSMGMTLEQFVLHAVRQTLNSRNDSITDDEDPFWTDDAVFEGRVPEDYSAEHDKYLYSEQK